MEGTSLRLARIAEREVRSAQHINRYQFRENFVVCSTPRSGMRGWHGGREGCSTVQVALILPNLDGTSGNAQHVACSMCHVACGV